MADTKVLPVDVSPPLAQDLLMVVTSPAPSYIPSSDLLIFTYLTASSVDRLAARSRMYIHTSRIFPLR